MALLEIKNLSLKIGAFQALKGVDLTYQSGRSPRIGRRIRLRQVDDRTQHHEIAAERRYG